MKELDTFDNLIASFLNRLDNRIKYNKTFADKYYKEDNQKDTNANFKYFKEKLLLVKNIIKKSGKESKILDIGCGTGRFLSLFKDEKIFGIDINQNMLNKAELLKKDNKSLILFKTDIINFNRFYKTQNFDFIYSIGVFGEHALIDKKTLNIIFLNLKAGGYLFFTMYDNGLRRKGISKLIIRLLEKFFQIIKLRNSAIYISRRNNLEEIIRNMENIEIIYKIRKSTSSTSWNGNHIIVLLKKKF
ncbi:class I SAM-dependent DNA methyltransferase [Prochlorococcus marinus]|uniref:class I SAM-dependent DNA methyltransferase n=1 Tax=Prochlorococcus marinus TaxID=1219 RepID=UPI001AD9CBF5|nr:class I SAM-dependent methyltransferase [Prochlorococcus marinus]MBO8204957.1 class I SAM-dependent methyltransferase [Prochlorococcus marinus CUG1415]MBW3044229.1 hypothetical protein [Prochlorococcus marinus str. MU1415]